jgi:hypothetical protein
MNNNRLRRRDFEEDEAQLDGSDREPDEQIAPPTAADLAFIDDDDTQLPEEEDAGFHRRLTRHFDEEADEVLTQVAEQLGEREKGKEKETVDDIMADADLLEEASQHLAPERDALREVTRQLGRNRQPAPPPVGSRYGNDGWRDAYWRPPKPEISPETLEVLRQVLGMDFEKSRVYPEYMKLYEAKAEEDHDRLSDIPRKDRIWKRSPWKLRVGTGPYQKSDRIPWLLHQFIPYGWQDGGLTAPEKFLKWDPKVARTQFNCLWIPEGERTEQVIYQLIN